MKYVFATDEDLDAAGIRKAGNTDRNTFRKKILIGKLVRGESVRGRESFELMGETI